MSTADQTSPANQPQLTAVDGGDKHGERWSKWYWLFVFVVALAVGLPSLRGGFIGGDDVQLIRDNVLVNRPSIEHSILLFKPDANRDLYQPIPLLTFAMNFAIVQGLNLTGGDIESPPGAWVFHLTNVLIHAACAVCVFWLLKRLSGSPIVSLIAAILFAVHPLQVESIAWLNGRMIMLSTLFILLSLIYFDAWIAEKRWGLAGLMILFVVLSLLSKVRPCLPGLFLLIVLWRREWKCIRTWALWGVVVGLVGASVLLNMKMSSGILEAGQESVTGNPIVRGILGLAWYIKHTVVPVGLAAWYPLPENAAWSSPGVLSSLLIVAVLFIIVGVSLRSGRTGLMGLCWFLGAIVILLPMVPSRNMLAADRYMYLAGIGLFWLVGACFVWARNHLQEKNARAGITVLNVAGGGIFLLLFVMSVMHMAHYRSTPARQLRTAMVHPDVPGVWERVGKAYYATGDYDNALKYVQKELETNADSKMGDTGHLMGMILYRLGQQTEGVEWIQKAIDAAPDEGMGWLKLGIIQNEQGIKEEAIRSYEAAAERMPQYLPALVPLGQLYLELGRTNDAREIFSKALGINPYHMGAGIGMAQIEMANGQFANAAERLTAVVQLAPYRADAWTNLGVCYAMMNQTMKAANAYEQALAVDPSASTAALNLAVLKANQGDIPGAATLLSKIPDLGTDHPPAMGLVVQAMVELASNHPQRADSTTRRLLSLAESNSSDAPEQLLVMLQGYAAQHPENPFAIYLASLIFAHQGQIDAARAGIQLFKSQCSDPVWQKRADEILATR